MVAIRKGQYLAAKLKNEFSNIINETIEIEESEAKSLGLIGSSGSIEPTPYEPIIEPTGQQSEENVIWDDNKNYLTFEALEEGVLNFNCNILYKIKRNNENNWSNDYITLENNEDTELLQIGDQIKIKCTQEEFSTDSNKFINNTNKLGTTYTIKFNCFGSVDDSFKHSITFQKSYIVDASNLILSKNYSNYFCMFFGCTALTTAPELPATKLTDGCYNYMFKGCTALTTAPELPATRLSENCYQGMFEGCTSLITAPELPATILTDNCYNCMFYDCTSLNYIKCLATDMSASGCLYNWVRGVNTTGTFVKDSRVTWSINTIDWDGIPPNWNVINETY